MCFFSLDDSRKEKTEIQTIHPTSLIRHSCVCLLQALAIGCGLHANSLQIESVRTVSSLLQNLLDAGTIGRYLSIMHQSIPAAPMPPPGYPPGH